jgi:flagellar biosynthesis/type III secretory pathway M-ring protein FliF/YscJ
LNTLSESSEKVNFSLTSCIKQALGMSESSRKKLVTRALEIEFQRIIDINKKIDLAVL